jgi:hypothetical protein
MVLMGPRLSKMFRPLIYLETRLCNLAPIEFLPCQIWGGGLPSRRRGTTIVEIRILVAWRQRRRRALMIEGFFGGEGAKVGRTEEGFLGGGGR